MRWKSNVAREELDSGWKWKLTDRCAVVGWCGVLDCNTAGWGRLWVVCSSVVVQFVYVWRLMLITSCNFRWDENKGTNCVEVIQRINTSAICIAIVTCDGFQRFATNEALIAFKGINRWKPSQVTIAVHIALM